MKCGIDIVDKMAASYNIARNTKRWPLVTFYGMLNIVFINAFVILRHNDPTSDISKERRLFIKCLVKIGKRPHVLRSKFSGSAYVAKYSGTRRQDNLTLLQIRGVIANIARNAKLAIFAFFLNAGSAWSIF